MNKFLLLLLISFTLFNMSCKKDDSSPVDSGGSTGTGGKVSTGSSVDLTTQVIGSSGGKIVISKPGDKLNGLELTVPANAFTTSKSFKISYADIKSHQFGANFNPISPVISVTYEGGYASKGMTLKIPITLPKGHFAMGFFYDETAGTIEGIPILALDSTAITIATKTFSSASSLAKRNFGNDLTSTGKMIIASISESNLNSQTIINSGFQLGVDDWEFINYGSYISSGGHCAGQSMTAMWYYYEKKLRGAKSLFHLMDTYNDKNNPTKLWQDNPIGYRFASTIQEDFNWTDWIKDMEFRSVFPTLVWDAFALSMLLTGEPQSVLINNSQGKGGHAMIVFKVNVTEKKLYIADPNYPNNRDWNGNESIRTIDLVNGTFKPYETGLTAGANSTTMDQIAYFGKTAYIDWGQLSKRWAEVENKTIGNDRFPAYELKYKDNNQWLDVTDNLKLKKDSLILYNRCAAPSNWIVNTDHYQVLNVYNESATEVSSDFVEIDGTYLVKLKPGDNKLGFYMTAHPGNDWQYNNFKWFTITYDTTGIPVITSIIPTNGKVGDDISIWGKYLGTDKTKGKIYFSDNIEATSITNWTDTRIDLKIPAGSKSGNVYIVYQNIKSNTYPFTVNIVVPTISSFSKSNGIIGDTISITGKDFGTTQGTGKVFFGSKQADKIVSWSDTKISVVIPSGIDYSSYVYVEVNGYRNTDTRTFTTYNWWLPLKEKLTYMEPNIGVKYTFNDGTSGSDLSFLMAYPISIKWNGMKFSAELTTVDVQNSSPGYVYTTTTTYKYSGELDNNGMNLLSFDGLKILCYSQRFYVGSRLVYLDSSATTIQFKLKNIPYYGIFSFFPAEGGSYHNNPNFQVYNSAATFELIGYDVWTTSIDYNYTPPRVTEKLKSSTGYSNVRYSQLEMGVPKP